MMFAWTYLLMLSLAATEAPAPPWVASYAGTAFEVAQATQDPEEIATLVAIGWEESRFKPDALSVDARGRWQTSAHWGPPTAETALRLVRLSEGFCGHGANALSWFANGGPNPRRASECRPSALSAIRMRLARKLLREVPPPIPDARAVVD